MKPRAKNLFLTAQILLTFIMLVPPPSFAVAQSATLSIELVSGGYVDSSGKFIITYPTFNVSIKITPVVNLTSVSFWLRFNDAGEDILEVPSDGVKKGDFMPLADVYWGVFPTPLPSILAVLVDMPGKQVVTGSGSVAKITFRLKEAARAGSLSGLVFDPPERASATAYTGGDPPTEAIQLTLQPRTVEVDPLITSVTLSALPTVTVEKPITLSSTLIDGGGNPIADQKVDYFVDSLWVGRDDTDLGGFSSITYWPATVGTFTVRAQFNQTVKYAASNNTALLTVDKMGTTLTLSVQSSIKKGETVYLFVTLKKDGISMDGARVDYYIDSGGGWTFVDFAITNTSGIASIIYTFSSVGVYQIKAEYLGTANYAPSSDTATRTVALVRTSITVTVTPSVTKADVPVTISANLKDENGDPLFNFKVDFYVAAQKIGSNTTDTNGDTSIKYTPSVTGTFKVEATYSGSTQHSSSTDAETLIVNLIQTSVTLIVPPTATLEKSIRMTTTLKDEYSNPISNANINYYIRAQTETKWTKINSNVTNIEGIAFLDFEPTTAGAFFLKANYSGSAKYAERSSELAPLTVNKILTTLTLNTPTTATVDKAITIFATLKDANQKPIQSAVIDYILVVRGMQLEKIGSAFTNNYGVSSISYTHTDTGTIQISAVYAESPKYLGSTDEKSITIDKLTTSLTLNQPATTRVGDTATLVATLKDENERALEGLPIKYHIYSGGAWNNIGTAITNSSGIATRDFTPSEAGTFPLRANFTGDARHAETTSQEVTLTVNKVQTTLSISLSNTTTTNQASIKIYATLKDEDAQPLPHSNIYYQVFKDGEWAGIGSATTNLQGIASLIFQPSEAGTLKFKALYGGDQRYAESTSEEATLEVTGEAEEPFNFLGFLGDEKLTVLDLLFWGIIILVFSTLVVYAIWRKIKQPEIQT